MRWKLSNLHVQIGRYGVYWSVYRLPSGITHGCIATYLNLGKLVFYRDHKKEKR